MADLNLLTDIEGVAVGHATDLTLGSGVTAIIFDEPAIASCSVLGGAPAGASYVISSAATAAPVPEPETYALLAAGLGVIGFLASRRRRD